MTFDLSPLIVCDIIVRARKFHAAKERGRDSGKCQRAE